MFLVTVTTLNLLLTSTDGLVADEDAAGREHLSTMRKLSGKRKYNQTAGLMISGGKR